MWEGGKFLSRQLQPLKSPLIFLNEEVPHETPGNSSPTSNVAEELDVEESVDGFRVSFLNLKMLLVNI